MRMDELTCLICRDWHWETSMLEDIKRKSDAYHKKQTSKAAEQHEQFQKTIAETLAGVKRDIEEGWEEDEEAM